MPDLAFPDGFVWGAATASYQIEGAATEDGRGRSIWDTFSHTPGNTLNGDTGDVADDHYHRWADDLDLMARLGLGAYRFSIAWPRVQPGGSGPVNEAGLDFYDRLVDGLLERGITPLPTLYHWDLPQPLEDAGGWPARSTAEAFAGYTDAVVSRLADRVGTWITINEPWCAAFLGYAEGVHAPGRRDPADAFAAAHHLNLAHGLAHEVIRSHDAEATISISLNLHVTRPASDNPRDVAAADHIDLVGNRVFLDPLFGRGYSPRLREVTSTITDWSFVREGDTDITAAGIDLLGINYYSTSTVRASDAPHRSPTHGGASATPPSPWPAAEAVEFLPSSGEVTAMGWNVDPAGLTELLLRVAAEQPGVPMIVTENGSAWPDEKVVDGRVHDDRRIDYLDRHLVAVHDAVRSGADVRGYLAWSLLDNFEWAYGYDRRFGIVHVDYESQARTVKDSGLRFAQIIAANGL